MTLYIAQSRPRKDFKKLLGNANHLIITALVGLDAVERGIVQEVPEDLHAAWSPKDPVASARRSRRLILDMVLIRAIDAIDVYLREAIRKPTIIQSDAFRKDLDAAGLSIFQKLKAVERNCKGIDDLPLAIIFVMVAWRNRSAHSESDRDAPIKQIEILKCKSQELSERFRGIDADMLLSGYNTSRSMTFKEIASLINAAHHLISELDAILLRSLDIERHLKEVIWTSLLDSQKEAEPAERARMRRAASIWGKDPLDKAGAVIKFLKQQGFSDVALEKPEGQFVPSDLLSEIQKHTPKSVLAWSRYTT
jgi:hypothetical protein